MLAFLQDAGIDTDELTRDDLASLDEFHLLGREGTRSLAELADIQADDRVLDVGCGIGGPARTLAAEVGCQVVGVDLTAAWVEAAVVLTERMGFEERITFQQGNALDLAYPDAAFDVATFVHMTMNVPDKHQLFSEAQRVLRPDGRLGLFEVLQGEAGPSHFPAPWADTPEVSFLATPEDLRASLEAAGLDEQVWADRTDDARDWLREMATNADQAIDPTSPGFSLLMGPTAPAKLANQRRNLEEGRIRVVQAVYTKSA